jgi:hypothetical protein
MIKNRMLIIVLSIFSFTYCYSQDSPEIIAEKFFSHLQAGNPDKAIESLPMGPILQTDTTLSAKLLARLNENQASFGKYCGYELIEQNEISESYIFSEYLIKYLDAPRRIQFVFYKPTDKWQINQVNINYRERQTNTRNRPVKRPQ